MECFICSRRLEKGYLCSDCVVEALKKLNEKNRVNMNPSFHDHCLICGGYENRVILDFPSCGPICDKCILDSNVGSVDEKNEFLLSFEMDSERETLQIHGDEKGLQNLCEIISNLVKNTKDGYFNHYHLMTPEWAGYELSDKNMGGKVIHGVKIYCWKGEVCQK